MSKSKCLGWLKIEPLTEFLENLLLKKSPIEYFWSTLIWLLTIVFINMFFKSLCIEKALSHWLHWYGFSPVCSYTWFFRSLCIVKSLSHWLHWYGFLPECTFICFSGQYVLKRLHYMGYIDRVSHHCVHTYDFLDHYVLKRLYHIGYIDMASLQCVHTYAFSDHYVLKRLYHIGYIDMAFHQCVHTYVCQITMFWKYFFSKTLITLATLIQFLVSMYSQMIYQMIILWKILVQ